MPINMNKMPYHCEHIPNQHALASQLPCVSRQSQASKNLRPLAWVNMHFHKRDSSKGGFWIPRPCLYDCLLQEGCDAICTENYFTFTKQCKKRLPLPTLESLVKTQHVLATAEKSARKALSSQCKHSVGGKANHNSIDLQIVRIHFKFIN